jgi:adenosylcobinamide kinase/adenosylcobinamide-phosphate guanylyltransferase
LDHFGETMPVHHDIEQLRLVLGGANSGKSLFAENLVRQSGRPRRYIATAQAWDDEMRAKISAHKAQRGTDWITLEAPLDLVGALALAKTNEIVLLDCVTLWLTNMMMAEQDITQATKSLCTALSEASCPVVVVSNEVGQGIVPNNAMARAFINYQGNLNQALANVAQEVFFVIAGLPQQLKGHP